VLKLWRILGGLKAEKVLFHKSLSISDENGVQDFGVDPGRI